MMDFPTSFGDIKENEDQVVSDSPGDALGALKKVVEGRQKRVGTMISVVVSSLANTNRSLCPEHS